MSPDISGLKFGKLTVLRRNYTKTKKDVWICYCECSGVKVVTGDHLKSGRVISCGCLGKGKGNYKHGQARLRFITPEYRAWCKMKERCTSEKDKSYKNYGGRGITICDEWSRFENFYKDMGDRPKNTSIDRIDNNKGYYKENCRWATKTQQANNTRKNVFIEYSGVRLTLSQWSRKIGIDPDTLDVRINKLGWSIEKAMTKKVRKAKILEYMGHHKTIKQWSEYTGVGECTLNARIRRGWPIKKALETSIKG